MTAQTDVSSSPATARGAAAVDPTTANWTTLVTTLVTGTMAWMTGVADAILHDLQQLAALPSPTREEARIVDLGVLDGETQVRSREFDGRLLVELVSPENQVLARRDVALDGVDTVRVAFDCSDGSEDIAVDRFEGELLYVDADTSAGGTCPILWQSVPIPSVTPMLPPLPQQNAVV